MYRFRLHKLLIILMVVGLVLALTIAGCLRRQSHEGGKGCDQPAYPPSQPGPSEIKTLKVLLQGPFVVVVRRKLHRIRVLLPKDGHGIHEFRYPDPQSPQTSSKYYHFTLSEQGLEINRDRPYIDHGFDDFNVVLTNWPPRHPPEDYVVLDLPIPDVITYIPPLERVVFGPDFSPRPGQLPVNQVLEYKVRDGSKVVMHSPELGNQSLTPDCERRGRDSDRERPEAPRVFQNTGRPCEQSATYYFGVTLSRNWNSQEPSMDINEHAKRFFNEKVLPSIFERPVPEDKMLLQVGTGPYRAGSYMRSMPTITPIAFRDSPFSGPRIIYVGPSGSGGGLCLGSSVVVTDMGGGAPQDSSPPPPPNP